MIKEAAGRVQGLLKASHFGPTMIVVTTTFFLARTQYSVLDSSRVALAIFAGQLVVGWSNDLMDFKLDSAANRVKKPLVSGEVSQSLLQRLLPLALLAALLLSLFGPLGLVGTLVHFLGILSGVLYNAKLKSTIFSPIPYIIAFGGLPWAIYLSADKNPPAWLFIAFILISTAFHFLNVLKDLEWDIAQGVLGLPQLIGKKASITAAIALVLLAIAEALLLS